MSDKATQLIAISDQVWMEWEECIDDIRRIADRGIEMPSDVAIVQGVMNLVADELCLRRGLREEK